MKRPQWAARLVGNDGGRRYITPKVALSGPGIGDIVGEVIEQIADVATYDDAFTVVWLDFVTARRNVQSATEEGCDVETRQRLDAALEDAKDAVLAELPATLLLSVTDARWIAGQLVEACGRIDTVAA